MTTYKVIQWGAGLNGRSLIRAIARHPDLELVGCRVWNPDKAGLDAGVLAEIEPLGVVTTTDVDELYALPANVDCGLVEDPTYRPEAMVGGAIPLVPEVVAAAPGLVLPTIYAPYRARF